MTRTAIAQVIAAVLVLAGLWWTAGAGEAGRAEADTLTGLLLVVLAVAAALRPRHRGAAVVAAIAALLWFAGPSLPVGQFLHRGALAYLVLAYPGARLRSWWTIAVVAAVSAVSLVPAFVAEPATTVILGIALVVAAFLRLRRTARIARRPVAAALAAAIALATAWALPVFLRPTDAPAGLALSVYLLGTAYVALLLLIDVAFDRSPEEALIGVVIDLGGVTDRGTLRERLARVIGDPDLWLAYRLADGRYVDDGGRAVVPENAAPDRVVTTVEANGAPIAVLVHDRAIRVDPAIMPQIAAAASLALRNVELHADVRARAADVQESSDRLLIAENEARQRLSHDLEAGPRRRLRRVADLLGGIGLDDGLDDAAARADDALRRFGRGLQPAASDDDLGVSLTRLAAELPFPVEVHTDDVELSPAQRDAVWFICAEALSNATKHADPQRVAVAVRRDGDDLVVTVRDDGRGGASMGGGSGLRGLRERAEALHGGLEVRSPHSGGTEVRAWLPVNSSLLAATEAG